MDLWNVSDHLEAKNNQFGENDHSVRTFFDTSPKPFIILNNIMECVYGDEESCTEDCVTCVIDVTVLVTRNKLDINILGDGGERYLQTAHRGRVIRVLD